MSYNNPVTKNGTPSGYKWRSWPLNMEDGCKYIEQAVTANEERPSYLSLGMRQTTQAIFVQKRIISAVKKVKFVSDRMSYIILKGPCVILF
jgi:hypothetical protein